MAEPAIPAARALRPSLVIHGDCQGEILAGCLLSAPAIAERYEVVYLPHGKGWNGIEESVWRRCAIVWRQLGSGNGEGTDDPAAVISPRLDPRCLVVTYPSLWFSAIWPHHVWDPLFWDPTLTARREHAAAHGFSYSDSILVELSKTTLAGPALFDRYLELDAARAGAAEATLESSLHRILARERQAQVSMAGYIAANFRTLRLFNSFNHPTRALMRELLRRMVRATWPQELQPGGELAALHDTCRYLDPLRAQPRLLRMYDDPVSPAVAAGLGLAWWSPDDAYLVPRPEGGWRAYLLHEFVAAYIEERRLRMRLAGTDVRVHIAAQLAPAAATPAPATPAPAAPPPAPDEAPAMRLLAESHAALAKGDVEAAIAPAQAAAGAAPRNLAAAVHLAYLLIDRRPPEQAEQACRRALALAPDDSGANHAFSLLCARTGRLPEAIAAARKASLAAPGNLHAAAHLGNLLRKAGDRQGAEAAYRLAIAAAPRRADLHVALGELYAEFGLVEDALASARHARELAPNDARAAALLSRLASGSTLAPA